MRSIVLIMLLLLSGSSEAQWRYVGQGDTTGNGLGGGLALGVHAHTLFSSNYKYGVFRYTVEHGWAHADDGLPSGKVSFFASYGRYDFASTDNDGGYRSSDTGTHWSENAGSVLVRTGTYLYSRGLHTVFQSSDSGNSWHAITAPMATRFCGVDAAVLAAASGGIFRSVDSGATWVNVTAPTGLNVKGFCMVGSNMFAGGDQIYRSTDSGQTWATLGLKGRKVGALATSSGYLFAGTDSGLFVSLDTGYTWRWASEGMGARPSHFPDVQLLAVMDSVLYAYVDAGDWALPEPLGRFGYITARPIREMVDTTHSSVVQAPGQVADDFLIYPNPTRATFTIESSDTPIRSATVFSLLGEELVHEENVGHDLRRTVDLSKLASGTYFIRIVTEKGVVMKKVVRE